MSIEIIRVIKYTYTDTPRMSAAERMTADMKRWTRSLPKIAGMDMQSEHFIPTWVPNTEQEQPSE